MNKTSVSCIPNSFGSMKKILALLVFGFTLGVSAIAQPTINFSTESPCSGQNFCMDVTVEDFTDIKSLKFTIQYDPSVLQNPTISGIGLPGMTVGGNFIFDPVNGFIHVDWESSPCSSPTPGIDLPDGNLIFQVCFTAMGTYAQTAEVCIAGLPVPEVFREGTGCANIGLLSTCGLVSVCVRPVELLISDATAQEGDLVCVDFRVTGFDALRSMQFTINWNPAVLNYENCVVGSVPNLSCASSFGTPPLLDEGTATFSWSYTLPNEPGITLQDSFLMFQLCFRVVGSCEESTLIEISDAPTMIEVTNDIVAGTNITFLPRVGTVTVGDCDPTGLQLTANCGAPVNLNDNVCVEVIAGSNFNNVSDFAYLMQWNASILEFDQVTNLSPLIGNFNLGDFNTSQVDNGVLGVNWESTPFPNETLPAGTVMYEVCFNVVGLGGNSPFNFTGPTNVQIGNGPDIGINPTNCEVEVIQPAGVVMNLTNAEAIPGEVACVDVSVSNFNEILSYQFSMAWDPGHMEFQGINNIALPEADMSNFGLAATDAGLLFFSWDPSTDYTVTDGTVIFQLCFTMLSQPNVCDELALVDLPLVAEAVSATSNGENIGVTSNTAEVCTLFPEGYGLIVEATEGGRLDTACVAFSVTSFDDITNTSFEISWDPSSLQYTSVELANTWPGLTVGGNFNLGNTGVGSIVVDWSNATGADIGGVNDTTVVFEVCYALIGTPGECFPIEISDTPAPVVETLNGPGSVLATDGEMCINDRLILESATITAASCAGTCDGAMTIVVTGGQGPLGTTWTQGAFTQFTPLTVEDLCATVSAGDTLFVRVFDQGNPALTLDTFFIIPLAPDQPEANAGDDRLAGCGGAAGVVVTGTGSTGPGYSYFWETEQGGPISDQQQAILPGPGKFVFFVRNASGCTASDTIMILEPPVPVANAGTDQALDCFSETIVLDGSASTATDVSYQWNPLDGGAIVPGEETMAVANATAPGSYELVVRFVATSCEARDTVVIANERDFPNANGGVEERQLGCTGDAITLDGSASENSPDLNLTFQWYDPAGVALAPGIMVDVATLGSYNLIVTNEDNGCRDTATVTLIPSLDYPQVTFSGDSTQTCTRETAIFTATISPDTVLYDFSWTVISGGPIVMGTEITLSPEAGAGVYQISVTNPNNSCTTLDTFIVQLNNQPPIADAGEDFSLSCNSPTYTLSSTGSTEGDSIVVTWTGPTGNTIPSTELEVNTPGAYVLEILNMNNGCSATDTIFIDADGTQPPAVSVADPEEITCTTTFTTLTATAEPTGTYEYAWSLQVPGMGNIIGPTDEAVTQVDAAGIYVIVVTDPNNGCSGTDTVVVVADTVAPVVNAANTTPPLVVTCATPSVIMGGDGTSVGPDYTYQWTVVNGSGATVPTPNDIFTAEATSAGSYILTVRDVTNGCIGMDTAIVTADTISPVIPDVMAEKITCLVTEVTLDASATTPNTNITILWTGTNGAPTPADQLITTATTAGLYTITVRNNANGCESSKEVEVGSNEEPPVITFATPPLFSCAFPSVVVDASASGPAASFSSITWSTMDGGTITPPSGALAVTVNAPGIYELTLVRADNGCTATGSATVSAANDTPVADAGPDFTIGCGEMTVLDGSGSTTGNYQWSNISGGATPNPATAQNPSIDAPGTYRLVVTNPVNNCMDSDTVVVTLNNTLENANAGPDQDLCGDFTSLTANLPAGTTGLWSTTSSAAIIMPDLATTEVTGLINGQSAFVWTLSAPGCANYSADTVFVVSSGKPIANNDVLNIGEDTRSGSVNVISNDVLTGITNFEVTLLSAPSFGMIDSFANNTLNFSVGIGAEGSTELTYQICNLDCAGQCDTATIIINVEDDGQEPALPNTITPNGDGLNEALVFDILLSNPAEEFPNNELIVFNRWGDIVYQSKPYTNNWQGTNNDGNELPHGTYYYILRLNIGNREIIRGDVTIVK